MNAVRGFEFEDMENDDESHSFSEVLTGFDDVRYVHVFKDNTPLP
jgi:hypothetical protein